MTEKKDAYCEWCKRPEDFSLLRKMKAVDGPDMFVCQACYESIMDDVHDEHIPEA